MKQNIEFKATVERMDFNFYQTYIWVKLNYHTNLEKIKYGFKVEEITSKDDGRTWIKKKLNGGVVYRTDEERKNNDTIEFMVKRDIQWTLLAKYKWTIFLDENKTKWVSIETNSINVPIDYYLSLPTGARTYFIDSKEISDNIFELELKSVLAKNKSTIYCEEFYKLEWTIFKPFTSSWPWWRKIENTENKSKIIVEVPYLSPKVNAYVTVGKKGHDPQYYNTSWYVGAIALSPKNINYSKLDEDKISLVGTPLYNENNKWEKFIISFLKQIGDNWKQIKLGTNTLNLMIMSYFYFDVNWLDENLHSDELEPIIEHNYSEDEKNIEFNIFLKTKGKIIFTNNQLESFTFGFSIPKSEISPLDIHKITAMLGKPELTAPSRDELNNLIYDHWRKITK